MNKIRKPQPAPKPAPTAKVAPVQQPAVTSHPWKWALFIFLFATAIYANTWNHEWVLDDYGVMVNNIFVKKGIDGFGDIMSHTYRYGSGHFTDNLYRPLSQLMFAIEWQLSPDNPTLSHCINILFYALCCVLSFHLTYLLFKRQKIAIAILVALLYAAHPIHTEVVANVKGRDDIMALFFLLLTAIAAIKYIDTKKIWHLPALFLCFLLAMFAKESSITWLAVMPVLLFFFRQPKAKEYILPILLTVIPAAIYLYTRHWVTTTNDFGPFQVSIVDNYFYDENLPTRWATAIMLLGKYLLLLLVPYSLVCDYSYSQLPVTTFASISTWIALLVHLALVIYAFRGLKKKDPISFAIFFYIITMSIFSNLVYLIGSSFADRFLFMPSLGFCLAIAVLLYKAFKIADTEAFTPKNYPILYILSCLILILYSGKTISRAAEWESQYKLFSTDVKKSDKSAHMHMYWGLALRDKGIVYYDENKYESEPIKRQDNYRHFEEWSQKAIREFKTALRIYPRYAECHEQLGILYTRLAEVHPERNYIDSAKLFFEAGLHYLPSKATMLSNLAKIYFESHQVEQAKKYYQLAVFYDPRYSDAYFNLGSVYGELGQYDSSFYYFRKSLDLDPNRAEAYSFMGLNYYHIQKYDSAIVYYDKAIAMDPRNYDMQYMKGVILYHAQKYEDAIATTTKALRLSPNDGEGYYLLGLSENALGHGERALHNFSECLKRNPQKMEAYYEKFKYFRDHHQIDSARYYYNILAQSQFGR